MGDDMARSKITIAIIVILLIVIFSFITSLILSMAGKSFGEKIGIVEIEGVIVQSKDAMEDIIRFKENEAIRGVIVRINSPGGSVGPTQEIYREIKKLRENKKVYVSMGSVCASGGYYIATAGEKIFANPSTITGSIGVIMEYAVIEDLLKKIGIQAGALKSGEFKDTGSPLRQMKPEEKRYLQEVLNSIHEEFIKDVAEGRKMSLEETSKLSDGRIYTGTQAKQLGLIDTIGNFYDAVDAMKKVLEIKGKPELVYGKRPFSFLKWITSSLSRELATYFFSEPFKYEYYPGSSIVHH
ncbi:MAG TPA: signal peptide peptidase SppA [Deltaproteobacteria bacterium]|nr:signal peptide peptidase SppA [Deltaproteobacteria bacterium]